MTIFMVFPSFFTLVRGGGNSASRRSIRSRRMMYLYGFLGFRVWVWNSAW